MSSHLANIPEAVRIAASTDPSTDPGLKQQAIDYLNKVRELCEETWQVCPTPPSQSVLTSQDCLALYIQGAGAPGPSSSGRDGKEKLGIELRMYCEQVVDVVLTQK
jgi:exportin-T